MSKIRKIRIYNDGTVDEMVGVIHFGEAIADATLDRRVVAPNCEVIMELMDGEVLTVNEPKDYAAAAPAA
jgi:hypothetical protein